MMQWFPTGWAHYLVGGVFIGLGVAWLFLATGRVGGMSTVFSSTWSFVSKQTFFQQPRLLNSRAWRLVYALGLILGAAVWWLFWGNGQPMRSGLPVWQLLLGGLLVGYGARRGNGCTSGHGICGMGRLSVRSIVATLTFMAAGVLTVLVTHHLL